MNLPLPKPNTEKEKAKRQRDKTRNMKEVVAVVRSLDHDRCRNPYCSSWRYHADKRGWFQAMGGMYLDPPHHIIFKSQGGDDSVENLILLCNVCHRFMHQGLNHKVKGRMSALKCAILMLDELKQQPGFRHEKPLGQLRLNLSRKEPVPVEEPA